MLKLLHVLGITKARTPVAPNRDLDRPIPASDLKDLMRGAAFIPAVVTDARRRGMTVNFNTTCSRQCCWYWEMPFGVRVYHFVPEEYEFLMSRYDGKCPECGNTNIGGATHTVPL